MAKKGTHRHKERIQHKISDRHREHKDPIGFAKLKYDIDFDVDLDVPINGSDNAIAVNTPVLVSGYISVDPGVATNGVLLQIWYADSSGTPTFMVPPGDMSFSVSGTSWSGSFAAPPNPDTYTFNIQGTCCPPRSYGITIVEASGPFVTQ